MDVTTKKDNRVITRKEFKDREKKIKKIIGDKIYQLFISNNVNQSAFAKAIDVPKQTISKWFSGEEATPNRAELMFLAEYFDVPINYFFEEDFQPTKDVTEQEICKKMHLTKKALGIWLDAFETAEEIDRHYNSCKQNVIFNPYRPQHSAHEKGMKKAVNGFIENNFLNLFLELADIEGLKAQTKLSMLLAMKEYPDKTEEIIKISHTIGTDLKTKTKALLFDFNEQITKILKKMIPENDEQFFRDSEGEQRT